MPKINLKHHFSVFCLLSSVFCLLLPSVSFAVEESITLTTYYPAPYGIYRKMVAGVLGVGNNDNSPGGTLTDADGPNPATEEGDLWVNSDIRFGSNADSVIGFNYPDIVYDRRLRVTAGREDTWNNAQGASVDLHGNDEGTNPGELHLVAGDAGVMRFFTGAGALERMTITNAGFVGIGAPVPAELLDVNGNTHISGNLNTDGTETVGVDLNVGGNSNITGSENVTVDLNVGGNSNISGTETVGTLTVSGASTMNDTVNINGNLNVSGQINGSHGQKNCYWTGEAENNQCNSGYYVKGVDSTHSSEDDTKIWCCEF